MKESRIESVRCVHAAGAILGEGPVWSAEKDALHWTDIHGRRVYRHEPATGAHADWEVPFRICSLAPRQGGGFIAGGEAGFVLIDYGFSRFKPIGNPEADLTGNRFNDGKLDLKGRFWAGSMDEAERAKTGALYRLDADLTWSRQDEGYGVANGPAFSPDGRHAYHTDSAARTVFRFRIEEPEGNLEDKQVFARFDATHGSPDGMTVDTDGCLWIAFWDGWCLRRLSPDGEVMRQIDLPVQRPTSCTFGGRHLDCLFVTSARIGLTDRELEEQAQAGGLFAVEDSGVRGFAVPAFAG